MMEKKAIKQERIFVLDCARKYFTPAWIKRLIGEIAAVGYHAIVLHFSEDMGMRLESKRYPWLAGGDHSLCVFGAANGRAEDDGKFITQEEMADILHHAASLGVEVIPSLDSPGHMNYVVKQYNRHFGTDIANYFHRGEAKMIVHGTSVNREEAQLSYSRGIDIANPEAVSFARGLYEEYGTFFHSHGCTRFNICGDELLGWGERLDQSCSRWQNLDHWQAYAQQTTGNPNAVAYDAFLLYMNDIAALLRGIGYTTVFMWNDDLYRFSDTGWKEVVKPDGEVGVFHWACEANGCYTSAADYLKRGHDLYNFARKYAYYILFPQDPPSLVTPEQIEAEWDPYRFDPDVPSNNPAPLSDGVKGGGFCLWCDAPARENEDVLLDAIRPYFTAIAKKIAEA